MRILISSLFVFIVQFTYGQSEEYFVTINPYLKYQNSNFECSFKSTDSQISDYCDTLKYCENFLTSEFRADSTYMISLSLLQKDDFLGVKKDYVFIGRFKIGDKGCIILLGKHPFYSNTIRIREIKKNDYIYTFFYKFKLSEEFHWTTKRKMNASCDGDCTIERYN